MTKNLSSDSILHSNPKDTIMLGGLKRVDFGFIPDDWLCLTLSEICELTSSKRIFESDYVSDGIPFYRGQEVSSLLLGKRIEDVIYIDKDKFEKLKAKFGAPEQGDILITAVGTLGNSFLVNNDEPFYFKDGNLIWARKIKNTNPRFLLALLEFNKQRVLATAIGSSQKALTMAALKPLQLPIPSSPAEQTAIANALSDVDALIQELEKLIVKKQAIKTATMQQLLTGRTRLPQFAHHPDGRKKGYKPSELGEIPEDWEASGLASMVSTLNAGVSVNSIDRIDAFTHGKHILKTSCVTSGYFNESEIKSILPIDLNRAKCSPEAGCIIVSRMNTPALVGEIGYVSQDYPEMFLPDRLWQMKFKADSSLNSRWLAYVLSYPSTAKKIKEAATGTSDSMKNISKGGLLALRILTPSFNEQTAIATILSDMDEEIQALDQRLNKTRQIKQGMMQELLTGKTRLVKPAGAAE
ncbi:restriction endonuclease subunit S [Vibrio cholerae]|uniref:restriction endonuclease subunit S n=1 Tax=Vibrio cholerae TaxID=666 RepID=UPI002FE692B4